MRVAAIDIGTVTSRLFIADVNESGVMPLCRKSVITNLGEGVDASGRLSDEAIARTVEQVARYKEVVDEYAPVDSLVALATSASRDAENSDEFVGRLRDVGVELSVIPGSREAELSFLGASNDFRGEDILFADIGGGSTELAFGRACGSAESVVPEIELHASRSFDIGCRRMTERFLKSDPPSEYELGQARAWAIETLAPFFEEESIRFDRLVAVAGTPTSVVAVRDSLVPYDSSRVHKVVVAREEFDDVAQRLCALPLEERKKVAGIQPKRAGVFPAGVVILDAVMSLAKVDGFTASESDILIGIVLDALRS
ncbi:Ppx/GppA phosphatase family protein [Slackia sp.]|uniref:Ppx/GppA phosphatase family protein n=1 Tax=Slackia sp. TaxID=2049041 RepID=UPI002E762BF3|nr:Ppx/GppA phosphatase family protein [Slackia sp.]MEE0519757.1 Ppx/GppA phosphatase family protein [Slackia sp.]